MTEPLRASVPLPMRKSPCTSSRFDIAPTAWSSTTAIADNLTDHLTVLDSARLQENTPRYTPSIRVKKEFYMHVARFVILALAISSSAAAQTPAAAPSLDYEFFKTRVQPIFLTERSGHARCIACHGSGTPLRLQPPAEGRTTWTEEESRKNFDAVRRMVVPGSLKSRLLMHPLAEADGGDFYHNGGKHWSSRNDAEWLTLKAWVMGEKITTTERHPRIIQTNSAGDNVHVIDPATNKVVGIIRGIEAGHGAGGSPDGSRIYISDEAESTLDVIDAKSLAILKKIPLSGHPNNMAVGKDGSRVYVGIIQAPGGVDVIDTTSMQRVKTVPTQGTIHNAYVTPDGRYVVAGSIAGSTINVIDAKTDEPAWTVKMDLGIRPMTFNTNPDGSIASYRINLGRTWEITSRFEF